jgi:glycosyltransferase involved in cell wall biosynthesis
MKILILNRRDVANPSGGGAEIYTHEIARGLVNEYKCEVTVFASRFPGAAQEEIIDGVRYIREGNEATVHLWGFYYGLRNRRNFDRILDEFNGFGFLTFFLPNSILLIHQLYREFWFRELGFVGAIPYLIEPVLIRFYKGKRVITVSNSTKKDLEQMGFRDVSIVMNAVKRVPASSFLKKKDIPTLVFLGRLKSTKRPEDAIKIFRKVKESIPTANLWIIGRGPEEEKLKMMAKESDGITFWGWVEEEKKMKLLRQAHLLLVPGVREGFGINVIEAASAGTPAVGYNVPGLRDSICNGETGYLVSSMEEAASRAVELLGNRKQYERMSLNCISYAREFDWRKRVEEFWQSI